MSSAIKGHVPSKGYIPDSLKKLYWDSPGEARDLRIGTVVIIAVPSFEISDNSFVDYFFKFAVVEINDGQVRFVLDDGLTWEVGDIDWYSIVR